MAQWKKPTNQEMVKYYDSEIKRFEKIGGLDAKLNIPFLKERKEHYKNLTKEWYDKS